LFLLPRASSSPRETANDTPSGNKKPGGTRSRPSPCASVSAGFFFAQQAGPPRASARACLVSASWLPSTHVVLCGGLAKCFGGVPVGWVEPVNPKQVVSIHPKHPDQVREGEF
jgi:hypothetical protein